MQNTIFNYVDQENNIKSSLRTNFGIKVEKGEFKKNPDKYLLLLLPLPDNNKIKLKGMDLQVVDHHFTLPATCDKKTNSHYHYTVILRNPKTQKKYRVHLYFDKLDRITVEPKLFTLKGEDESGEFIDLSTEDLREVDDFFAPYSSVILHLREQHKLKLSELNEKKLSAEKELEKFSQNIDKNITQYLVAIEMQIETLSIMESIGGSVYTPERIYYERLLKQYKSPCESSTNPHVNIPEIMEPSSENQALNAHISSERAASPSMSTVSKTHPNYKVKVITTKPNYSDFFKSCEKHIAYSNKAIDPKLIQSNINLLRCLLENSQAHLKLLKIMKPNFRDLLKNPQGPTSQNMRSFFDQPVERIVAQIQDSSEQSTRSMNLYIDIIESKEATSFTNGIFAFTSKSKHSRGFIARLEELKAPKNSQIVFENLMNHFAGMLEFQHNTENRSTNMPSGLFQEQRLFGSHLNVRLTANIMTPIEADVQSISSCSEKSEHSSTTAKSTYVNMVQRIAKNPLSKSADNVKKSSLRKYLRMSHD